MILSRTYVTFDLTSSYVFRNFPFFHSLGRFVQDWISALKVG